MAHSVFASAAYYVNPYLGMIVWYLSTLAHRGHMFSLFPTVFRNVCHVLGFMCLALYMSDSFTYVCYFSSFNFPCVQLYCRLVCLCFSRVTLDLSGL